MHEGSLLMPDSSPDPQIALGRAIRLRREQVEISQADLGLDVGVEQAWISRIESGAQNPAWGTVDRIARGLGLSLGELATLADELQTEDRKPINRPLRSHPSPTQVKSDGRTSG